MSQNWKFFLGALILTLPPSLKAEELDLAKPFTHEQIFGRPKTELVRDLQDFGFEWQSSAKKSARSVLDGVVFGRIPVQETIVRFDEDGEEALTQVFVSFYSVGDADEPMNREEFDEFLTEVGEALVEVLGEVSERERKARNLFIARWLKPNATYEMRSALSRSFDTESGEARPEYVNLRISPPAEDRTLLEEQLDRLDQQRASTRIVREPTRRDNGDVVLEGIPMVDQGEKGYCAVATAERVMRYYERDIDQHTLAQLAQTGRRGTSRDEMKEALDDLSREFRVRTRDIWELDERAVRKMTQDYNRLARRQDLLELDLDTFLSLDAIYASYNKEAFIEARAKDRSGMNRFVNAIESHIAEGIPPLWTLYIGIAQEEGIPEQAFGGHMRLIIGYNLETSEILYSDSWGAGHEEKRMDLKEAWAATTGLYTLESF